MQPDPLAPASGFKSSEFTSLVIGVVTNLVGLFVVFGYVHAADANALTPEITAIVTAVVQAAANSQLVYSYIKSRTQSQTSAQDHQYRMTLLDRSPEIVKLNSIKQHPSVV